jgi:hypothetical protein
MVRAIITFTAECASPARSCSRALLIVALAGLLTACGGDVSSVTGGGPAAGGGAGGGGGAITCISGSAPAVLTWDASVTPGVTVDGYRVYYGTAQGTYLQAKGAGLDAGPALTFTVMGLSSGTTYFFVVTAYNANFESFPSNEVCKTIS